MARKVSQAGGNLWRLAAQNLGDATQANRLAGGNNLLDPFLTGVVTVTLSPVDLAATGGLPFQPVTVQGQVTIQGQQVANLTPPPPLIIPPPPPPPFIPDNPPIAGGWTAGRPGAIGLLTWWIPPDPMPTPQRQLPPSIMAAVVNNSPFANRGRGATTNSAILTAWIPPDPLPTPQKKLPPALIGARVDQPPVAGGWTSNQAEANSILISWIPPDPMPTPQRRLPPSLLGIQVDNSPFAHRGRGVNTNTAVLTAWIPPDPLPTPQRRLPPALLDNRVDVPPPSAGRRLWLSTILSAWQPPDPIQVPGSALYATHGAAWDVLPNTPTGLVASLIGTTAFTLAWTNPGGREVLSYQVQYSLTGQNNWQTGPNVPGLSAQVTGLTAATNYDARVSATNAIGTGAFSAAITMTTAGSGTPIVTWQSIGATSTMVTSNGGLTVTAGGSATVYATPQGIHSTTSISSGTTASFEVTFTAKTQNCTVGLCTAGYNLASAGGLGGDNVSVGFYPFTGPNSQIPQSWFFNNNFLLNPPNSPPADVTPVTVSFCVDATNQKIWATTPAERTFYGAATWNDSATANPATGAGGLAIGFAGPYFIAFTTQEAGGVAVLNAGSSAFSITFPSGFPTWGGSGGGGGSNVVAPGQITGLGVGQLTASSAVVTFTDPSTGTSPFTHNIQYSTDGGANFQDYAGTPPNNSPVTVTGLQSATAYLFRAYASNAAGTGAASTAAAATTLGLIGVPDPVAGVTVPATTASTATVRWLYPTTGFPSTGFQVQYRFVTPSSFVNFALSPESPNGTTVTVIG
jgi:hypothetical protein